MPVLSDFKKILSASWFWAIGPALILSWMMPHVGTRYTPEISFKSYRSEETLFADLNSDSISERIYLVRGIPYNYIGVKDQEEGMFDQWNLTDSIDPAVSGIFTGNYDRDNFLEIYVFTYRNDSLFLNLYELSDSAGTRQERIFVSKIALLNGHVLSSVFPAGFADADGDGFEELYVGITSSFRLGPRVVISYNIAKNLIKKSETACIVPIFTKMSDADNDHHQEIYGLLTSSGNYRSYEPYSDSSTWFMVYDEQLRLKFPPPEFPGFANGIQIEPFNGGYSVLYWRGGADTSQADSRLILYSPGAEVIRYRLLSEFGINIQGQQYVCQESGKLLIIANKLVRLDGKLKVEKEAELPFNPVSIVCPADFDGDGRNEYMIYSEEAGRMIVFNEKLQTIADQEVKLPSPPWKTSVVLNHADRKIYFSAGREGFFMKIKENRYYYLGYLTYPAIYLFFILFILLIRKVNTLQIVHREQLKQRLLSLQIQGIKAQLDPHFTFNTLNSIASLIYLGNRKEAYDYMNRFTMLLRSMLNDAERVYRSLDEEIEFVKKYLELEKLRFGERFKYSIDIGEGVTQREEVPKLVLHTFAENAIKHGLMPRSGGGILSISIAREDKFLCIRIEDNGIGREKAAGQSTSTGKGLKLTWEFYEILNQINGKLVSHCITDLYDTNSVPTGTLVEIKVQVD